MKVAMNTPSRRLVARSMPLTFTVEAHDAACDTTKYAMIDMMMT